MLSGPTHKKNGLRQRDALACPLLDTALDRVIRDAGIHIRESTAYKSAHILAYDDDIDVMGRTQGAMKEAFISLKTLAKKMHLQINMAKNKIYANN
jgi:hypothetical protein